MKFKEMALGEMEEVVLLSIALLSGNSYCKRITQEVNARLERKANSSSIYMALLRLSEKGYITHSMSKVIHKKGGKAKKIYALSEEGKTSLKFFLDAKIEMYERAKRAGNI
ncbi:MAG: hypothetical protein Tsb0034_11620 [Ekhidna sp.]